MTSERRLRRRQGAVRLLHVLVRRHDSLLAPLGVLSPPSANTRGDLQQRREWLGLLADRLDQLAREDGRTPEVYDSCPTPLVLANGVPVGSVRASRAPLTRAVDLPELSRAATALLLSLQHVSSQFRLARMLSGDIELIRRRLLLADHLLSHLDQGFEIPDRMLPERLNLAPSHFSITALCLHVRRTLRISERPTPSCDCRARELHPLRRRRLSPPALRSSCI